MQSEYRGHRIRLLDAYPWCAELVELASGAILPTRIEGTPGEPLREVWAEARRVIDLYLEQPLAGRVLGPVRPWQMVFCDGSRA